MKIIISGSKGFVGKNLYEYLLKTGNVLKAISRTPENDNEIGWSQLNNNNDLIKNVDVYIHLAGKAHDIRNTSNANEYFHANTELTKTFFDIFLQSPARDFIYFSSVKAAADIVDGILYEDTVPNPKTPYGQSKLQAEEYLLAQRLPAGKRLFIMRPCMIHGPGNKGNLNLLYKFVQKGIPYPLAAFDNERSYLSINNLNFIMQQLINDASIPGGVYNLADDIPLSTIKVINIIAKVNGINPKKWKINQGLIKFFAKAGDKLHLPLNSEKLKKLTESYVVSNKKIKIALNIAQLPVSSEDGLKITIQSFHSS